GVYEKAWETSGGAGYMSVRKGEVVYVFEGTFEQGRGEDGVTWFERYVYAERRAEGLRGGAPERGWIGVPPLLFSSEGF
ncbi:unnamed protein product, partial [Prorocentrum cordatum]